MFQQNCYRYASHFVYTTLAEQTIASITKLLLIMDTTFYMFGDVEYLRWTNKKGQVFEAVKEQVEILGKEFFEADFEEFVKENDIPEPDGISFQPMWQPTNEELAKSIEDKYRWMRDMEIM